MNILNTASLESNKRVKIYFWFLRFGYIITIYHGYLYFSNLFKREPSILFA